MEAGGAGWQGKGNNLFLGPSPSIRSTHKKYHGPTIGSLGFRWPHCMRTYICMYKYVEYIHNYVPGMLGIPAARHDMQLEGIDFGAR